MGISDQFRPIFGPGGARREKVFRKKRKIGKLIDFNRDHYFPIFFGTPENTFVLTVFSDFPEGFFGVQNGHYLGDFGTENGPNDLTEVVWLLGRKSSGGQRRSSAGPKTPPKNRKIGHLHGDFRSVLTRFCARGSATGKSFSEKTENRKIVRF